jgi:hypothetical protein
MSAGGSQFVPGPSRVACSGSPARGAPRAVEAPKRPAATFSQRQPGSRGMPGWRAPPTAMSCEAAASQHPDPHLSDHGSEFCTGITRVILL